jgi:hypothetical protein
VLQRRVVSLALAVTLLLALVAIAARGRPLGSGSGNGGGLPLGFWDYTYTTIVIIAVPVLVGVLVIAPLLAPRSGKRPSFRTRLLRSLGLVAVLLAFEFLVLPHLHLPRLQHRQGAQPTRTGHLRPGQNRRPASGTRSLRFRWDELAIVLGLLLTVAAILVARRSRANSGRSLEIAPEALAAALDESLDDLRSDPDLRRAIVAAYARMETVLATAGLPRHPAEAPLEYLERALLALDTSAEAVRRLTDLFEWARFSQHEPEPSMRDDAVDALSAVRDELRASELIPA